MRTVANATSIVDIDIQFKVKDGAGSWQDLTSRVFEVSGTDDLEADSNSITVSLRNAYSAFVEGTNNSLDPMDTNSSFYVSSAPLLGRYHECYLNVSKDGKDTWTEVFRGFVGPGSVTVTTDVSGNDIVVVKPVDISQPYKEDFWYDKVIYKDADAVSIMSQMFTDRGFNQSVVAVDDPSYHVEDFESGQTNLWAAQKNLIEPTGYIYRDCWSSANSAFKPCVYDPDRTKSVPDATFTGDFKSRKLDINESDARSKVVAIGRDRNTGSLIYATAESETAKQKYGLPDGYGGRKHKTLWYAAQGTGNRFSMVDTMPELQTLANNILSDVQEPAPDCEISLQYYHPGVEIHDLLSFIGNDYTINIGVTSISWSISADRRVGSMTIKGATDRIIGQFRLWLQKDATSPEMRNEIEQAMMKGDGLPPDQPAITRYESYWGYDSSTGSDVPITVFECTPVQNWDFRDYAWTWWIVGESERTQQITEEPRLKLTGLPVGAKVQVYVEARDWSTVEV